MNTVRIVIKKPCFKDELLAACPLDSLNILNKYRFDFPKGYHKQWKHSIQALSEISDEEKAREKANEYNNAKIEDKY